MSNYSTKKRRQDLYRKTFLKWKPEQLVQTLTQVAIETSSTSLNISKATDDKTFSELYTSFVSNLADLETMIEACETMFPSLRPMIDKIKREKLIRLSKKTKSNEEASKYEEKAEEKRKQAIEEMKNKKPKTSLLKRFFNS